MDPNATHLRWLPDEQNMTRSDKKALLKSRVLAEPRTPSVVSATHADRPSNPTPKPIDSGRPSSPPKPENLSSSMGTQLQNKRMDTHSTGTEVGGEIHKDVDVKLQNYDQLELPGRTQDAVRPSPTNLSSDPAALKPRHEVESNSRDSQLPAETATLPSSPIASESHKSESPCLPRQMTPKELSWRLSDWIQCPDNAMPNAFNNNKSTLEARKRIIDFAQLLTKEVLTMHQGMVAVSGFPGLLSPRNVTLYETQRGDVVERRIEIKDLTSATYDDRYVAPWLRRIPKAQLLTTIASGPPKEWDKMDQLLFRLGMYEADVWSLAAIFWALCHGSESFMMETFEWYKKGNFVKLVQQRLKDCRRWKFFILILVCLQGLDGKENGLAPLLTTHGIEKIVGILELSADEEYDQGDLKEYVDDMSRRVEVVNDDMLKFMSVKHKRFDSVVNS